MFDQLELGETPEPPPVGNNEARSAPIFHEMLATARDDDGRIERYLAGRGLPGMAHHVRLVTMKGGRIGMAALAVDPVIGDAVALQVLPLDSIGRPATVDGKKVRRTYTSIKGWTRDAAFTLPALEGGPAEVVMCEGTEDALSVRAVGWTGPVVATLGKGNIAHHSPPGTTVILLFDGDVAEHEIDDALEAHRRANRTVRIARLPADTDPNDMLQAGRGAELLELLTGAEAKESTVVEIEKALLRFPFDADGHARYMAARRELAKKFKLTQAYLDQVRKRLAKAAHPELDDKVGKEIIRDIEPAAHPVDGEEIFRKLMAELTGLVVFDKDDAELPSGAIATALWVMSTHYYEPFPARGDPLDDFFDHATRLMISAGTIRSGKTRLLETIGLPRPAGPARQQPVGGGHVPGLRAIPSDWSCSTRSTRPACMRTATPWRSSSTTASSRAAQPGASVARRTSASTASGSSRRSPFAASAGFRPPPRTAAFASSWCASR